jgi:hypothetical protein
VDEREASITQLGQVEHRAEQNKHARGGRIAAIVMEQYQAAAKGR